MHLTDHFFEDVGARPGLREIQRLQAQASGLQTIAVTADAILIDSGTILRGSVASAPDASGTLTNAVSSHMQATDGAKTQIRIDPPGL